MAPTALVLGLTLLAIVAVTSTIPFVMATLSYRQRDNGLAYLLLVSGVAVWNGLFVAQLLTPEPLVKGFFLALSVVGAVQAGLGFLLFAATASSTPATLSRRSVYLLASLLGGVDIAFAVTAPAHTFYWEVTGGSADPIAFATVTPGLGYWLHTVLLVGLFGAGTALFVAAWRDRPIDRYPAAYSVAGTATVVAVLASNMLAPGGLGVASIVAVSLTTVGWVQAVRGQPVAWLRGTLG